MGPAVKAGASSIRNLGSKVWCSECDISSLTNLHPKPSSLSTVGHSIGNLGRERLKYKQTVLKLERGVLWRAVAPAIAGDLLTSCPKSIQKLALKPLGRWLSQWLFRYDCSAQATKEK